MREEYTGWEIDFQAQALAEKTVNAPLEALAQLCPLAEQLMEQMVTGPDEPPQEVRDFLGLETMDEARWFFDQIIFSVTQSAQDVLAQYLYQGQAARNAGVSPREWLRVHRMAHLAVLKLPHHFKYGSPLTDELRQLFFLADQRNYNSLLELHQRSEASLEEKLRLLGAWLLQVRKVAAAGLLRRQQEAHNRDLEGLEGITVPHTLIKRSARIPVAPRAQAGAGAPTPAMLCT